MKGLKWTTSYLTFLGFMSRISPQAVDGNIFGGFFYKVNPGVLVGVNAKVDDLVTAESIKVDIKPAVLINALDFSAEASAEGLGTDNKFNLTYVRKPDLSNGLMPYINLNASYKWRGHEFFAGVGASFTKFWLFSRFGFNLERNFKTFEDRVGLYADAGTFMTKLYIHKRDKQTSNIGMDLEFSDLGSIVKNLGRANLHFGVTASKWNNAFVGVNFDFN